MSKLLFILLCCVGLMAPALSQEQTAPQEPTDTTVDDIDVANDIMPDEDESSEDDSDLDRQTYEENDDVFVPTEEIPSDEPIPFPSDI